MEWWRCAAYVSLFLSCLFGSCIAHIGERCHIFNVCIGTHVKCDSQNICRCPPQYPVQIGVHKCARERRYRDDCTDNTECNQHDKNMYCSQIPYQSRCECYDGFLFSEDTNACTSVSRVKGSSPVLLPLAVGISVALSSMLCCFLALYRICYRASGSGTFLSVLRERGYSVPWREREQPNSPPPPRELWNSDTLPSYDVAVSLKSPAMVQEDLPPAYTEAVSSQRTTPPAEAKA